MMKSLSLIKLPEADSTVKATVAQQASLNYLAKVVLDKYTLDYFLDEQKRICAVADASCCTQMNTVAIIQTHL